MLEQEFYKLCDIALSALFEEIEKLDNDAKFDTDYSDGILKIVILATAKTYVINRNSGNQKIWYSSPISGADYFSFDEKSAKWLNAKEENLSQKLISELAPIMLTL